MKTFIYLIIILNFTQTVICKQFCNEIGDELLPDFIRRSVRRKREYTRWRAQTEKPTEFLVKVFDDDDELLSAPTKIVPRVPVLPRRTPPKIIVSGITVRVPPRTPEPTTVDWADEYTRFKPPAPKPGNAVGLEPHVIPELPFKQSRTNMVKIQKDYGIIKPPQRSDALVRLPQRVESPPASPQFVLRTSDPEVAPQHTKETPLLPPLPPHPAVQYAAVAPVTPVAFVKPKVTAAIPLVSTVEEPTKNRFVTFSKYVPISKSIKVHTTMYDGTPPTRTTVATEEVYDRHLDIDEITSNDIVIPRSTVANAKDFYDKTTTNDLKSLLGNMIGRFLSRTAVSTEAEFERNLPITEIKMQFQKETNSALHTEAYPDYDTDGQRRKGGERGPEKPSLPNSETTTPATRTTNEPQTLAVEIPSQVMEPSEMAHAAEESQTTRADFEYYEEKYDINAVTGKSVDKEGMSTAIKLPEITRRAKNQVCSLVETTPFNFTAFATLADIYEKLRRWASRSPFTEIIDITQGNLTTMENPIYMLTVDDPSGGQIPASKQTVMIVAGIQGRDHYAVAASMYLLYQFIERSEVHSDLLNKYRFWIIPVFNPDGYEYSKSFTNRREWKKNLRQNWETCKNPGGLQETCKPCEEYGIRCYLQPCYGINLDRNFEYQWIPGHELRAEHPCGDLYAGKRQLSEVETFSLTNYLHEQRMPLYAFIAYKEGDVLGILYPYSHTRKRRNFDKVYRNRATTAAAAAFSINGRPYMAGQTSEFLPLYAGGIEDWMDVHLGIDNSYAILMNRPGDAKFAMSIERVAHEAYAAMDTLLKVKGTMSTGRPLHAFAAARRRYGNSATAARTTKTVIRTLPVLMTIFLFNWFS